MTKLQESEDDKGTRCGIGRYRPDWLQVLNNPFVLCVLLGTYIFFHGAIVTAIESVSITSLEKTFQLSSVQIGWISSAVHISAATVGTLASFYATSHKPRWLGLSAIVGSIGLFLYGSPHFLTGPYDPRGQDGGWKLCKPNRILCSDAADTGLSNYLFLLMLGNFLCGFSGSMILTVGISSIDDCLPATKAPLYIGLVSSLWFVGMAIGYVVGGQALKLYVDFDTVSSESFSIEPSDERWVGAWWLPMFGGSVVYALLFVTFSLYGAELPSARKRRLEKTVPTENGVKVIEKQIVKVTTEETERTLSGHGYKRSDNKSNNDSDERTDMNDSAEIPIHTIDGNTDLAVCDKTSCRNTQVDTQIDDDIHNNAEKLNEETHKHETMTINTENMEDMNFPSEDNKHTHLQNDSKQRSIKTFIPIFIRILQSPVVVFLDISVALIYLFQSPVGLFLPKIIQNQYNQTTATSGLLAGIFILPGVAIGQFLGGVITKQLRLMIRGCFCLAVLCAIFAFPGSIVWLLYCDRTEVYGLDTPYSSSITFSAVPIDNPSTILSSCNQDCSCRWDLYQPICDSSARLYYSPCHAGCTAIITQEKNEMYTNCSCLPGENDSSISASNTCDQSCDTIYYALPIMFIGLMLLNVVYVQSQTLILRLHDEEDKAFALGIMWLFIRVLGMIPGPLLLGTVLDKACDVWGKSCEQEVTSCLIYDNQLAARNLSLYTGLISLGLVLSIMTAFIIYTVSKRSKVSAVQPAMR